MREAFHAVLHDETARNRPWARDCAISNRRPCGYHSCGEPGGRRRYFCYYAAEGDDMSAKILIVDDEANTLASLSRAFRLAGHEAVVCDNAARALELALTQP